MKTAFDEILLSKIFTRTSIEQQVKRWKAEKQKVVFTNGVFDLIHIGHITYLAKAASLGAKLIIGVNSDASVRFLKGDDRPVNDEKSRAALLAALFFVSGIVVFNEPTPHELIASLLPDVLVKGGDYAINDIVGAEDVIINGGKVKTIKFIKGYSSTRIIEKIRNHPAEAKVESPLFNDENY